MEAVHANTDAIGSQRGSHRDLASDQAQHTGKEDTLERKKNKTKLTKETVRIYAKDEHATQTLTTYKLTA